MRRARTCRSPPTRGRSRPPCAAHIASESEPVLYRRPALAAPQRRQPARRQGRIGVVHRRGEVGAPARRRPRAPDRRAARRAGPGSSSRSLCGGILDLPVQGDRPLICGDRQLRALETLVRDAQVAQCRAGAARIADLVRDRQLLLEACDGLGVVAAAEVGAAQAGEGRCPRSAGRRGRAASPAPGPRRRARAGRARSCCRPAPGC